MSGKSAAFTSPHKNVGNFDIATGAVVCIEAQLQGNITIGSHTVIHPCAKILAETGPIVIGENNLIEENATIVNNQPGGGDQPLVIGNGNVFEVGSYCAARAVGNSNIFEPKSHVGNDIVVTDECIIGASCSVDGTESLPRRTIICGSNNQRYILTQPPSSRIQQLDYLTRVLPNFHKLIKGKLVST
ncbi:dynactin subunit 6-like [Dysidea avara]|uniref:dynactin subunit 6-like n=1 Tax=Dysidea avara TaxID=196820 RepID=UPI00331886D2